MKLVLASTSPFRKELLQRLDIPFDTASPDIDESAQPGETPEQLVARLSEQKAKAVAEQFPDALVIGSDQVATLDDNIIGKPGNHENAVKQLKNASGRNVVFFTGLCLLNTRTGNTQIEVAPFSVTFRNLSEQKIDSYLKKEQPYNCAGSFKSEGLGIILFDKMEGDDPNSLIGLPLIHLVSMLKNEGINV